MKRYTLPLILASTLIAQSARAQSSTPVIGYYKFDVPKGTTIWSCGFVTKKEFQGAMTSRTVAANSVIFQSGASFGNFTTLPHYVEILSGPNAGWIVDIIPGPENDATHIKVNANLGVLAGTETYCVRKHNTLGTVLPSGSGLIDGTDTVTIYTETGGTTYTSNGSNWEDGGANDADGTIIYPGQGFIIDHPAVAPATVTIGGNAVSYVKYGPTKVPLYFGVPNLIGLVNPLVAKNPLDPAYAASRTQIGNYGLVASLIAGADSVDHYSQNGLFTSPGSYSSNGSNLEDGGANDVSTDLVDNGAGLVVSVNGPADGTYTAPQVHPNP